MSRQPCVLLRTALLAVGAFLVFSASTAAQTNISGTIFDGSGGPLLSGQTYIVTGSLTVPTLQTLTIQQGAIVKFNPSTHLAISGTLDVNGVVGDRVTFSSSLDDTAGGDTNGDGSATSPAPGNWRGLIVQANSTLLLDFADVRYGGAAGVSPVHVSGVNTSLTLTNSTLRDSLVDGLQLSSQTFATLAVSGCAFDNNGQFPVALVRIDVLPSFSNNTASGNDLGDYLEVTNGSLPASTALVVELDQLLNGILVMSASINVPATSSLTLPAGLVVKMSASLQISVSGVLAVNGTAPSSVVITSIHDDSVAGDTNKNGGLTTASAGDWRGVISQANSIVSIANTELVYGGASSVSPVHVSGVNTSLTLTDCILRDSLVDGLQLSGKVFSSLSVSGCAFDNNGQFPVALVRIDVLPGFSNNSASGNDLGDYLEVTSGSLPSSTALAIDLDQLLNGILVMSASINVPATSSLTLPAGLVVKMSASAQISVSGVLAVNGTALSPVVITSIHDDSVAGDTNKNGGATTASAGDWRGVIFQTNSTVSIVNTELVYGGASSISPVHVSGGNTSLTLTDCILRDSLVDGLQLGGQSFATLAVSGCAFDNNGQFPVALVRIEVLPGFSNNTASGNNLGDYLEVTSGSLPSSTVLAIDLDQLLNGILVMSASINVPATSSLTLPAGLVVKMSASAQIAVSGVLAIGGTGELPVVLTSILDDEVAGDTNKDATLTSPAPGNWRGCIVSTNGTLDMDHAIVRYGGASSISPIHINTTNAVVKLDAVRAEHSLVDGFFLQDADWVRDCVAWSNGQDGFDLRSSTFDLMRCTAVGNGLVGVRKAASHTGKIFSTVSWNNTTSNYDGLASGDLMNSLGDATLAGSNGNVNTDPLFIDEPNGDLRLTGMSICVDNGDPFDKPTGFDLAGFPRLLDGTLNFNRVVDMGAYEFDNIELTLTGTPSPGNTINLVMAGKAGLNTWIFLGVATFELSFKTFGPLTVNLGQPSLLFNFLPLPTTLPLAIPLDFPVGIPVYVQALGLDGTQGSDPGNMSNPLTITAE